jgi:hypothetical protein
MKAENGESKDSKLVIAFVLVRGIVPDISTFRELPKPQTIQIQMGEFPAAEFARYSSSSRSTARRSVQIVQPLRSVQEVQIVPVFKTTVA